MEAEIRRVLAEQGKLAVASDAIGDDDDLYQLGLTSHASVNLMLALEDAFDVEFPERMLRKRTFGSVAAIREALTELLGANA